MMPKEKPLSLLGDYDSPYHDESKARSPTSTLPISSAKPTRSSAFRSSGSGQNDGSNTQYFPMTKHLRPLLTLLLILLLLLAYHNHTIRTRFQDESLPFCSPYEMTRGTWHLNPEIQTISDLKSNRGYRPYLANLNSSIVKDTWETRSDGLYCLTKTIREMTGNQELIDAERKKEENRLIDVGRWEWKVEGVQRRECRAVDWEWIEVIRRLLESKLGLIILGDSISGQIFDSLALQLGNQGPIYEEYSAKGTRLNIPRALYLDPNHPMTTEILRDLDIPVSRLNRPIAQTIRSNHLLLGEDFNAFNLSAPLTSTEWYADIEAMAEDAIANDDGEAAEAYSWLPSVMLTSTGEWYETWINAQDTSSRMETYRGIAQRVVAHLESLASSLDFTTFYRTVSRAHAKCDHYKTPISSSNTSFIADQSDTHGWYLKGPMNDVFKSALSKRSSERTRLWDVEEMALQRPDGHRFPETEDCVHWCLPSVLDEWNWTWWHLLRSAEDR